MGISFKKSIIASSRFSIGLLTCGMLLASVAVNAAPTSDPDLMDASDSGTSNADDITNVTAPTFHIVLDITHAADDAVELLLGGASLTTPVSKVLDATDITNGYVDLSVTDGELGADGTKLISAEIDFNMGGKESSGDLSVELDTAAPNVTITPVDDINIANSASYAVAGTCSEEAIDVVVTIIEGGNSVTIVNPICTSSAWALAGLDASGLIDGADHITVSASQTDAAGNAATLITDTASKDTAAPVVTITPVDDINIANSASYAVAGTCSEEAADVVVTITEGGNSVTIANPVCTSSAWALAGLDASGLIDGADHITVSASQTDAAGNAATPITDTASKDTVVPVVTITAVDDINIANSASYAVAGTCSEETADVAVSIIEGGNSVTIVNPICTSSAWALAGLDASGLIDGTNHITVSASQTDAAGNMVTPATDEASKDTIAPGVFFVPAPADILYTNVSSYSLSGTCSNNGKEVTISMTDGSNSINISSQPVCAGNAWTLPGFDANLLSFVIAGSPDNITIEAQHKDSAGNETLMPATVKKAYRAEFNIGITRDISAPSVGDLVTYTVAVENNGSGDVTAANLGMAHVKIESKEGLFPFTWKSTTRAPNQIGVDEDLDIASGETITYELTGTVVSGAAIEVWAEARYSLAAESNVQTTQFIEPDDSATFVRGYVAVDTKETSYPLNFTFTDDSNTVSCNAASMSMAGAVPFMVEESDCMWDITSGGDGSLAFVSNGSAPRTCSFTSMTMDETGNIVVTASGTCWNNDLDSDGRPNSDDPNPGVPEANDCSGDVVALLDETHEDGVYYNCRADTSISTDDSVIIVRDGADALYMAPLIRFKQNFKVEAGGVLHAVSP